MNKKIANTLLVLYILFTLYNTLIPFNFQFNPEALTQLLQSAKWPRIVQRLETAPMTDIVGNIILFMPLGFLLYLWRYQRRLHSAMLYTVIVGLLFSMFIEFLQLFFKDRVSSVTDIVNNTLGTTAGALVAFIYLHVFAETAKTIAKRLLREQPLVLILAIFLILQLLAAAFPFNVTITISELKRGLKHANILPFQNHSLGLLLFNHRMKLDGTAFDWFQFIESILLWMCWGYLTALCYISYWRKRGGGGLFLATTVGFLPAIVLEFLQIFIVSRFCDINDVISNWLGTLTGLILFAILNLDRKAVSSDGMKALKPGIWIYLTFIIFSGLTPFDFSFSTSKIFSTVNLLKLVPFLAYFQSTSIWNLLDVIKSMLYFLPVGAYLSYRLYQKKRPWQEMYLLTGLTGLMIGTFIEFMQIFSPTRSADLTDALLFGAGGLLGTFSLYYYRHGSQSNP